MGQVRSYRTHAGNVAAKAGCASRKSLKYIFPLVLTLVQGSEYQAKAKAAYKAVSQGIFMW